MKIKNYLFKKIIIFLCLISLMSIVFFSNFLNKNDSGFFDNFQKDSESLVIGKFFADINKVNTETTNLGSYNEKTRTFTKYESQFGLQGLFFSFIFATLGVFKLKFLYLFNCIALALILTLISFLLSKKYNNLIGVIFYLTFLLSPWIIAMARNLYWVEFLMFLPSLLTLFLLNVLNEKKKVFVFLILIFFSSLAKSLCGYEFLSTIFLFTVSFPIIDLILTKTKEKRQKLFLTIVYISIALFLGFILAFTIHAYQRGDGNIFSGYQLIWKNDVLRRTIGGNADNFLPVYKDSLEASPLLVLSKYIFDFYTPIVLGIEGKFFPALIILSIVSLILSFSKSKKWLTFENISFLFFFLVSESWFFLGKSHSYIHTHINFIIWYFGFVQICFYITIKFIFIELPKFIRKNFKIKNE